MRDIAPYLILIGNCCVLPVLMFLFGAYVERNGMPLKVVRNAKRRSQAMSPSRFAREE